jgi:L-2-hydroxyglutarate oxidase LhgO
MESYVSKHDLQVRFGVKVDRIDRVADGWRLATSAGERTARDVIVATGHGRIALVGHLDVLDDEGMPRGSGGSAIAAGLYFLGYEKGVGVIGPRARRATRDLCQQLVAAR